MASLFGGIIQHLGGQIMQRIYWVALLAAMVLVGAGCDNEEDSKIVEPVYSVGSVTLVMPADTVIKLSGVQAAVDGRVIVRDAAGLVLPAIKVRLYVSEVFGNFVFAPDGHGDTTDATGTVRFQFILNTDDIGSGFNVITAQAGDAIAQQTLHFRLLPNVGSVQMLLEQDSLLYSPCDLMPVMTTGQVIVRDPNGQPMPDVVVALTSSGEYTELTFPFTPYGSRTDYNGVLNFMLSVLLSADANGHAARGGGIAVRPDHDFHAADAAAGALEYSYIPDHRIRARRAGGFGAGDDHGLRLLQRSGGRICPGGLGVGWHAGRV